MSTCPPRAVCLARIAKLEIAKDELLSGEKVVQARYADWGATYQEADLGKLNAEIGRLNRCLGRGPRRSVSIGFR